MASTIVSQRNQGDAYLQPLMVGSVMRKVKSRSRNKQRYFKLQEDGVSISELSKEDGKAHLTFSVGDLDAVREGHQSEVLQCVADEFHAERCFTLVFQGRRGNLDLVAESAGEAQAWIKGVRKLMEHLKSMTPKERLDHWIGDWFRKADKNKDGRMNFKEVRDLLKMMNIDMNEHHALHLFRLADRSKSETLEDEEFVLFYKMLTKREDALRVFKDYSGDGQKLSLLDLEDFLRDEQQERESSQKRALEVINKYEPSEAAKKLPGMSIDGFLMYLNSAEGSIFNPHLQGIYQDMSQPLCHYFISSSHNTYLLEDQLIGQSSVEGYIRALKRGCRCVELDCWDGPNGEPIIYHGHTFTSKILFKDVIIAVEKYAFRVSEYPLILSMENHCGVEQQGVMAQHLHHILGEKLLSSPVDSKFPDRLPSPQELMGKILIKGKKIVRVEETPSRGGRVEASPGREGRVEESPSNGGTVEESHNRGGRVEESQNRGGSKVESQNRVGRVEETPSCGARVEESLPRGGKGEKSPIRAGRVESPSRGNKVEKNQNKMAEESLAAEVSDEEEDIAGENSHQADNHTPKICKQHLSRQLSDCVVYCKSVQFTSFEHSRLHSKFYEMSSFTESKARKLIHTAGADFVQHNARQLTRIYPGGLRTDSSNFHPQDMWNAGCQLVALNFQTAGEEMDLNDGLFSQNGRCGYVLKPKFLRNCDRRFDPESPQDREEYQPIRLDIQVISGQQFPKVGKKEGSIVDPLVRVEVHGVPMDQANQETRHIDNNGFNPLWYDTVQFLLHAPELALVRFVVEDYDHTSKNDFIGQYTLPFTCIQPGYRHVPLLSKDGTSLSPSSLFVHIRITKLTGGRLNDP
ncbi:1-phosphatidylinositol 4,5-bisphosphate phosphodiesterase delta-4-like isoform X2 [Conger conger]|uniref:1-phosphatidylinositol 4,5-bisphosphate phosphodiesterase delta-4-like isoform X2 n=1 Tax=Conger conger TaxID=82655 RepID=UPI002A5AA731|nr:1-phosphatidylinositol 4,5-bisphosphate phosphodiesterase delta-4-like isoform X2 [Conger conger]